MKTIHFILGLHNHQPVGNFSHVFEEAYQKSYRPMLEALQEYPSVRLMYHTTGSLYDWLETHHPEYFDLVKSLIARGQLEMMTGAYQEPILAVIPDRDKRGQIQTMTDYLQQRFGIAARGLWMAERIWEPHLAKPLAENGIEFITLDDYHFLGAGMNPDDLLGYYRTDEQGYGISLFPISKKLRYLIPFSPPDEALTYLKSRADESGVNLLVMADDGEKFGLWPGTYEWVHKKGWLHRFFKSLESAIQDGWLKLTTCSQFLKSYPPRGRVYLPTASYFEMSAWSLPAQSGEQFDRLVHQFEEQGRLDELSPYLKGGFWRNFLAKYDESNRMYRKMLWVSEQLHTAEDEREKNSGTNQGKLDQARTHLYRAQCNCAYWHGVFGGLYLPHLRNAIYQNLLEAETRLNQILHPEGAFLQIEQADLDSDGREEVYLRNEKLGIIILPHEGGAAYELDFLPAHFNLLNTLRRQREAYHAQVLKAGGIIEEGKSIHDQFRSKEEGLERYLVYDRHLRGALIDHFLSAEETPHSLMEGKYYELGDFVGKPYTLQQLDRSESRVQLSRTGTVVDNAVELSKTVALLKEGAGLKISYQVRNRSRIPLTILFAPEFNFALLAGDCSESYYYQDDQGLAGAALDSLGISENVQRFSLFNEDDHFVVHLLFPHPTEVWRYPVETVSLSEGGFERVYQSSCVLPVFRLALEPEGDFQVSFDLHLEMLR